MCTLWYLTSDNSYSSVVSLIQKMCSPRKGYLDPADVVQAWGTIAFWNVEDI